MSPISELKKKKIEQIQEKIRKCAREMFQERGFKSVNFDEIADAAVISRSTLYSYYENKKALFFDIHIDQVQKTVEKSRKPPDSATGKEMILHTCKHLMNGFHENWINTYVLDEFIKQNIGNPKEEENQSHSMSDLVEFRFISLKRSFKEYFSYLSEFYIDLQNFFSKGVSDGSITTNLTIPQCIDYIRMVLVGIMDQFHITPITPESKQMKIDFNHTKKLTIEIIDSILKTKM